MAREIHCKFRVSKPSEARFGSGKRFPVSIRGWKEAVSHARAYARKNDAEVDVNLSCGRRAPRQRRKRRR